MLRKALLIVQQVSDGVERWRSCSRRGDVVMLRFLQDASSMPFQDTTCSDTDTLCTVSVTAIKS